MRNTITAVHPNIGHVTFGALGCMGLGGIVLRDARRGDLQGWGEGMAALPKPIPGANVKGDTVVIRRSTS